MLADFHRPVKVSARNVRFLTIGQISLAQLSHISFRPSQGLPSTIAGLERVLNNFKTLKALALHLLRIYVRLESRKLDEQIFGYFRGHLDDGPREHRQ